MAGIRLEFAQFGDFDSFDIIRSNTSMSDLADADLPIPVMTGLKTMYWVDPNVIEGKTYYYKVRVWMGSVSAISDEIEALSFSEYANTYLRLKSDVIDKGTNPKLFTNNGVIFSNNAAVFSGSQNIASNAKSADFNFGSGDFTIEFAMSLVSGGGGYAIDLRNVYENTGALTASDYANLVIVGATYLSWSNGSVLRTANTTFNIGQTYAASITRASGVLRIFVEGVKLLEVADDTNISGNRYMRVGVARLNDGSYEGWFKGTIDNVRITKGVAKYTADYTITYKK